MAGFGFQVIDKPDYRLFVPALGQVLRQVLRRVLCVASI